MVLAGINQRYVLFQCKTILPGAAVLNFNVVARHVSFSHSKGNILVKGYAVIIQNVEHSLVCKIREVIGLAQMTQYDVFELAVSYADDCFAAVIV